MHLLLKLLPSQGQSISSEHFDILKILLKCGADPTLLDDASGVSSLHFAVSCSGSRDVLMLLLDNCKNGVNIDILDNKGNSPLWCALLAAKFDIARVFIDYGADLNERTADGVPLLIKAISARRDDISRFLLDHKAIAAVTSPVGLLT